MWRCYRVSEKKLTYVNALTQVTKAAHKIIFCFHHVVPAYPPYLQLPGLRNYPLARGQCATKQGHLVGWP